MPRHKTWTLTDVADDVWLDSFAVTNDSLRLATPHDWSIRKRTLRGGRRDGVDLIEIHNGALSYSIMPTRGMGLWRGEYRGNFLGWRSPVLGPVHPHFVDLSERGGLGWLAGFDEFICRCGLSSNGPPGEDSYTTKNGQTVCAQLTLHGRVANSPAHHVEVRVNLRTASFRFHGGPTPGFRQQHSAAKIDYGRARAVLVIDGVHVALDHCDCI